MKNLLITTLFLTITIGVFGQIHDPVKWSTSVEKISNTEYKLISTSTIEKGWHLYSQNVPKDGPIPTSFTYDDVNGSFKIIGNTSEEEGHTISDPVFEMKIKFFENTAIFEQKIEVLGDKTTIVGLVEFMVCEDTQCLPPTEVDLVFILTNATRVSSKNNDASAHATLNNSDNNILKLLM